MHSFFELIFVIRGSGTLQIATNIVSFTGSSLLLIPPHLLHKWESTAGEKVTGIVIRFSPRALPSDLLALPEMAALAGLVSDAEKGLGFHVQDRERLRSRLRSIHQPRSALKLARFYVVLELIATFDRVQLLDDQRFTCSMSAKSLARLEAVKRYVLAHFQEEITRGGASREVGMNDAAFSRFFRESMGVTFVDYVANVRVRHAAILLGNRRDLSVREVAVGSGFKNLSVFHCQFKKRLGTTPNAYRSAANSELMAP